MNPKFLKHLASLQPSLKSLTGMPPVKLDTVPENTPKGGVYLISKPKKHLYVGRTKRTFRDRLKGHFNTATDSPFAFRLARERTGNTKASYSKAKSRKALLADPKFEAEYRKAQQEIREMNVRWVHEPNPIRQALLEIYVHVALNTPYNDFDNH